MKLFFLSMFMLLQGFISAVIGQAPDIQWQKNYGGSGYDYATCIRQTSDGGYITAGYTNSADGDISGGNGVFFNDCWVVKTNAAGNIEWRKNYGGAYDEAVRSIHQTADGNFIMAGETKSTDGDITGSHGLYEFWVVKLNGTNGAVIWQKTYGGSYDDILWDMQPTSDGGCIAAGQTNSSNGDVVRPGGNRFNTDFWLIKIDAAGVLQWQKVLGGSGDDNAYAVQQTADGGYIVTGESNSSDGDATPGYGGFDYWVVKLDATGVLQWQKSLGGAGAEQANAIIQTNDGGYVVAGATGSNDGLVSGNHGSFDYWIVKLNETGDLQWQKTFGGSQNEFAYDIQQTTEGGYIITGHTTSNDNDVSINHGASDFWLVKINASGALQWQKSLGGSAADYSASVRQTSDGGYILAGQTASADGDITVNYGGGDFWIVKSDAGGALPVTFGAINAFIKNGVLTVNWTAESETNNAYYIIEASGDGKNFTAISDKILSKAQDGNASTALQYSFTKAYALLQGMAIMFFLSMMGFSWKNRKLVACMVVISCFVFILSCNKSNTEIDNGADEKLFIQIAQVDKDGTKSYSKIIAVNNER